MKILIIKLGAAGDVLRTTPILSLFRGEHVTWITADENLPLLTLSGNLVPVSWSKRYLILPEKFDAVLNLEDDISVAQFVSCLSYGFVFGAFLKDERVVYSEDSGSWFDMSLISRFCRKCADMLKRNNRLSYQDILFDCFNHEFSGQQYIMPECGESWLCGDVAICPTAGSTWPMKNWSGYKEVEKRLHDMGYSVNMLPRRNNLRAHLADIRSHKCLLSGDSLPMHVAIGYGVPTVTLFTCTSPWEIYDYGLQTKIISKRLSEFFYSRTDYVECPDAIDVDDVVEAVTARVPSYSLVPK